MHQIGEKIKLLRELQNMKQDELAFHLDISPPALSDIERGITKKIDFLLIQKLTKIFNVDYNYFDETNNSKQFIIKKNLGQIGVFGNNYGSIMQCPEKIIDEIKKLVNGYIKD